jgi:transposase
MLLPCPLALYQRPEVPTHLGDFRIGETSIPCQLRELAGGWEMGKAIAITRLDRSAGELRELAVRTEDGDVVRRLLGMALLLDGWSRGEAASAVGIDRQTLCDWAHRYNAGGVAGLATAARSGRPPALSAAQMAELKELVIAGPEPEKDGVVRWRCVDLRVKIADRFQVTFHKRSVGKLLHKLGLTRLQPRPFHPKKDAVAQEAFKKTSPAW